MTPSVLAVLDVGRTIDDEGRERPTAVVDASGEPAVADLARVHAVEGIGDIATDAVVVPVDPDAPGTLGVERVVLLSVTVAVPVRCALALAFALPAHGGFLAEVAEAGELVIATTDPAAAAQERPTWLAIDLDGDALRTALAG